MIVQTRCMYMAVVFCVYGVLGNPIIDDPGDVDLSLFRDAVEESVNMESTSTSKTSTDTSESDEQSMNTWSIMWYLISFGGLILFFLLVSFSEVCCKTNPLPFRQEDDPDPPETTVSPPAYEHFAPPTYDSLFGDKKSKKQKTKRSRRFSVFVVPVDDKATQELPLAFGEVISRNAMGDGEVVTPPPPP